MRYLARVPDLLEPEPWADGPQTPGLRPLCRPGPAPLRGLGPDLDAADGWGRACTRSPFRSGRLQARGGPCTMGVTHRDSVSLDRPGLVVRRVHRDDLLHRHPVVAAVVIAERLAGLAGEL
ncbi:hypothetical protein GCM10018965_003060 [Nonomuraea roseola]